MRSNSIIRNTSALFIAHLAGRILTFILTILLPRYLENGFDDLGRYFTALWLTNLLAGLTELGLYTPVIREIAADKSRAQKLISNALFIRMILCVLAFGIMVVMAETVYPHDMAVLIYVLGISSVISVMTQLLWRVFRAFERMGFEAFSLILERVLVFSLGLGVVVMGYGIKTFALVVLISTASNFVLTLIAMVWKFTRPSLKVIDLKLCRELLIQSLPFALGGALSIVYFRIDGLMLKQILGTGGDQAVGWYGTAYNFVTALTIIPGAFMGAMFPVMSRMKKTTPDAVDFLYTKSIKLMFILALPIAVGITFTASQIIKYLYPLDHFVSQDQKALANTMEILIWSGFLIFLNTVLITVLRATNRKKAFLVIMSLGVSVNIISNLILIPIYGHIGAAVSMIISEFVFLIMGFRYIQKKVCRMIEHDFISKSIFASAVMTAGLFIWKYSAKVADNTNVILVICVAIVIYGGVIVLMGTIKREDVDMLKGYFPGIEMEKKD